MENYDQPGDILELTAPGGGVVKGVGKQIGSLLVIPTVTAAAGAKFSGLVAGVVSHTKAGTQAWTQGAAVYWNVASAFFTTSAAGPNILVGVAAKAVAGGAGDTTGIVRLDGVVR